MLSIPSACSTLSPLLLLMIVNYFFVDVLKEIETSRSHAAAAAATVSLVLFIYLDMNLSRFIKLSHRHCSFLYPLLMNECDVKIRYMETTAQ